MDRAAQPAVRFMTQRTKIDRLSAAGELTDLRQIPARGSLIVFDHMLEWPVKGRPDLEKITGQLASCWAMNANLIWLP